MYDLIEKIYIINLESSILRKKHMIKEINENNIINYEFINGIDKNSDEVLNLKKNGFVKTYPPCFRCNQNYCNCDNNILIKSQIGNWCSFIKIMKLIIKNNFKKLIMIFEDDIKFIKNGYKNLYKIINKNVLDKYNINFDNPILIRIGSEYSDKYHNSNNSPRLSNIILMSNPAFIINKKFAESFLNNLNQIYTTSDLYIHKDLINIDKTIQHFTLLPLPIFELSCGKFKSIPSEIHPKGCNKNDINRQKKHIKRIEYNEYLYDNSIIYNI